MITVDPTSPTSALARAEEHGWSWIVCERAPEAFETLARAVGDPVAASGKPPVARLTPQSTKEARSNTTSAKYGLSAFPPHTDFAHWPEPPRWLLFRLASAVSNTPTYLFDSANLQLDEKFGEAWRRAVWQVGRVQRGFLCSINFNVGSRRGFRWDADLMSPHGHLAIGIAADLAREINAAAAEGAQKILWRRHDLALLVDNWRILHARGPVASADFHRVLERIAIRDTKYE